MAETRAREPRGPVERICRSGNIRPGGYIGAVCGNFAAPFRPPLPWASEAALAKLQGIRIRYRARRHTIHGCGCHFKPLPPPRCRQRQSKRSWCMAITSRRGLDGQKAQGFFPPGGSSAESSATTLSRSTRKCYNHFYNRFWFLGGNLISKLGSRLAKQIYPGL